MMDSSNFSFVSPQKKLMKKNSEEILTSFLSPQTTNYTSSGKSDQENIPFSKNSNSHALSDGKKLQITPSKFSHSYLTSPNQKKQEMDRFIPLRQHNSISRNLFGLTTQDLDIQSEHNCSSSKKFSAKKPKKMSDSDMGNDTDCSNFLNDEQEKTKNYQDLLKEQTLDITPKKQLQDYEDEQTIDFAQQNQNQNHFLKFQQNSKSNSKKNVDFFNTPIKQNLFGGSDSKLFDDNCSSGNMYTSFSNLPVMQNSCLFPQKQKRKIPTTPVKVLDAPGLNDDFYVDMLDWSSQGYISVGLGPSIYLWNSSPNISQDDQVIQLATAQNERQLFTSLKFSPNPNNLAVGQKSGLIQIYDLKRQQQIFSSHNHTMRIGNMTWINENLLATGSKDKQMIVHDIRENPKSIVVKYQNHKQEICGIASDYNQQQIATGGNDNHIYLYDLRQQVKQACFKDHKAAVRALAFSPHQHGLLVTGGGSKDKTIKTWNTLTSSLNLSQDVDSQVCKIVFSHNTNEFISSHGFEDNALIVWKYQNLKQQKFQKLQVLEGHQSRVLFMALSPDKQSVVTGAGDETLKFWNVFPGKPQHNQSSLLNNSLISLR